MLPARLPLTLNLLAPKGRIIVTPFPISKTLRAAAILVILLGTFVTSPVHAQAIPSDEQIDRAIKCGMRQLKCAVPILYSPGMGSLGSMGMNMTDTIVIIMGPLGRVYQAANSAKEKFLPFTRADVTEDMLQPTLTISARCGGTNMAVNPSVTHIVIMAKGAKDDAAAVQPTSMDPWDTEVGNLLGAKMTREGKRATFSLASLPPGAFDIIIVGVTSGNDKSKVNEKDRARLFEIH